MRRKLSKSPPRSAFVSATDLEPAGHALHLGIEHEADAAHGFQYALCRVSAVLLVIPDHEPVANRISGSVVPATRRARRTGSEGFGTQVPHQCI